ncbi:glycoside hydrolase family 127 protein [Neobacillus sp. DY30]|uniref:glycoside hydrolase family 127 protein n=1 Tax=Neobacillus sp. DY30 TaxID=3047871 RepID=UPI0024C099D3|nr:glycoside hydrolase family 127 protein [Neobacillus sp. DY30]WHY01272.1 glycoside hydrolase family 127 protein [Neobacillus sp. DY30]
MVSTKLENGNRALKEFDLSSVRITGGPLKHAMELNKEYLLKLEPDRLLARFREYAGLQPKAANYEGWESQGISGHTLGHYLSATAMMAAATDDERFHQRVNYIVDELDICQEAHGTGYISGIPRGKEIFEEVKAGDIRSQGFDLNGGWVPLYSIHKLFAGLRDAFKYTSNKRALQVETKLGLWLNDVFENLNDEQIQEVLKCEYGGMSEVLADLAEDTGDERFWKLSQLFHHKELLDSLGDEKDVLAGRHANTQIPKIIGTARQYEISNNESCRRISEFFWKQVVHHHSYVIGGNSMNEHFGEPDKLSDRLGANTCETCNSYNMLKLTRHLIQWNALAEQGDFYERVLYNHILASQHPQEGTVTYFVSLDMGGHKVYNSQFNDFTCCVGTGMENHSSYGNGIYFYNDHSLVVNQYIPSKLNWRDKGIVLHQITAYPDKGTIKLLIESSDAKQFSLSVRCPYWAEKGMSVKINGETYNHNATPSSFITMDRVWENGDTIELEIPMTVRVETMNDNPNRIAFMNGPLVLAGDLGPIQQDESSRELLYTPVLVTNKSTVLKNIEPVSENTHQFEMNKLGYPRDVRLIPFYQMHDRSTSVYWDVFTEKEWKEAELSYKASVEKERELQLRTVDFVQPGEMQPERDHEFEGEHVGYGVQSNRKYRDTWPSGHFSFTLKVQSCQQNHLVVMYTKEIETMKSFDITVDGVKLENGQVELVELNTFVQVKYEIPNHVTVDKGKVKVTFRAYEGRKVPKVFAIRVVKE